MKLHQIVLTVGALQLCAGAAYAASTTLVSARDPSISPISANGPSSQTAISTNGRVLAFISAARDLVKNDTNERADAFVLDRPSQTLRRISLAPDGSEANSGSTSPAVSGNGRFVAFSSLASNLVPGDTNEAWDIFVYDRQTRAMTRVNVSSAGAEALGSNSSVPSISADGRFVTFHSAARNLVTTPVIAPTNVYVHDRQTGTTSLVSASSLGVPGDGSSSNAVISDNGRWIAYQSDASNLVVGDLNLVSDVFVYDRTTRETTLVSVSSSEVQGDSASSEPAITSDGRYVSFTSTASNLIANDNTGQDIFLRDRQTGETTRVSGDDSSVGADGFASDVSADGRYIAYSAYDGAFPQIYLRDRANGSLKQVSHGWLLNWWSSGGLSASLSGNGSILAFSSDSPDMAEHDDNEWDDAFTYNTQSGEIRLESTSRVFSATGPGYSFSGPFSISKGGRYAAFVSQSGLLVEGDTNQYQDAFLRDLVAKTTSRATVANNGDEADYLTYDSVVNGNGRFVAFTSRASNLVPGDYNDCLDVFVKDQQTGELTSVSEPEDTSTGCDSVGPSFSSDGRYVAFASDKNFVPHEFYGPNVYVRDRVTGAIDWISEPQIAGGESYTSSNDASISADGRFVAFESDSATLVPGDINGTGDIFVRDRQTRQIYLVSRSSAGVQANPGSFSFSPAISGNGRYVAFISNADNLVPGDTNADYDAFVFDLQTSTLTRVSTDSSGAQANARTIEVVIDGDGSHVAFASEATNLVANDNNNATDVFVRNLQTGVTTLASVNASGEQGNDLSNSPAISADGSTVTFSSQATNLIPKDLNGEQDVFARRIQN